MLLNNILSLFAAPPKRAAQIPCYCISHMEPKVPDRFFTDIIALGEYGQDLPLHISKIDAFWHEARPVAFASAGCFAMSKIIQTTTGSPVVGLCSFRKILLPKASRPDDPRAFQVEIRHEDVKNLSLSDTLPPKAGQDFFVAGPLMFPDGIIGQYSKNHILRDLLDFTSLCIDLGVLTSEQAKDFLLCPLFIPGGSDFGFYPAQWLAKSQSRLELVGRTFVNQYRERILSYERFEVRALSYLTERLGSYFVLMELMERYQWKPTFHLTNEFGSGVQMLCGQEHLGPIPPEIFGRMHVFVDSYGSYKGGLAD